MEGVCHNFVKTSLYLEKEFPQLFQNHNRTHSLAESLPDELRQANFLRSLRFGAIRKTWSQTQVTLRALLQILKNCNFTMKMEGFLSFITILVSKFCCLS